MFQLARCLNLAIITIALQKVALPVQIGTKTVQATQLVLVLSVFHNIILILEANV